MSVGRRQLGTGEARDGEKRVGKVAEGIARFPHPPFPLFGVARIWGCHSKGLSVGTMQTLDRRAFEKRQPGFGRFDLMAQASEVDEDLSMYVITVAVVPMHRPVDAVE